MRKKVSPTRMELFRLKRRLELATRGHKLLKDKVEALIRELLPLIDEYGKLSQEVEEKLGSALRRFALAEAASQKGAVQAAIEQNVRPANVPFDREWYMGVYLPRFGEVDFAADYRYSFVETAPELDEVIESMKEIPGLLLRLARVESTLFTVARELERTRRRTNALEYVVIPEMKDSRKEVEQKIGELERSDISRLMKVKEMLEAAEKLRLG